MRAWRVHVTPPLVEVARRSGVRLSGESLKAATSVLFGRLITSICMKIKQCLAHCLYDKASRALHSHRMPWRLRLIRHKYDHTYQGFQR